MSEFADSIDNEAIRESARIAAKLGLGLAKQRHFLSEKVAREFMEEFGLSGVLDEEVDTALANVLGTCVAGGIILGMKKKTDEASMQKEIDCLYEGLPAPFQPSIGRLIPTLVLRGVIFYRDEFTQCTPRVQEWVEEFRLLQNLEP